MPIPIIASLTFIFGLLGLIWSANLFVSGSASMAKHLGMTPTMIGLTIVAFGTSAPEMIVSAGAALDGIPNLGIGNAIGSNIANIGLVLGVTALIARIPVNNSHLRLEIPLLLGATLLAILFLWDLQLTRVEGLLLLVAMFGVAIILIIHSRNSSDNDPFADQTEEEIPDLSGLTSFIWLLGGLIALLVFADLLVWSASALAEHIGVSPMIIGLTVVALGTSLPELAASITSILKGHHDIALGNIIGSNMLNILAVMALPGIIAPSKLDTAVLHRDLPTMALLTVALAFIMWIKVRASKTRPGQDSSGTTTVPSSGQQGPSIGLPTGVLFLGCYIAYYAVIIISTTTLT